MPRSLTQTPNAKINLGLHITGRRADGYHLIETLFWPVYSLHDTLVISEAAELAAPELRIEGDPIAGDAEDNLVIKAWRLLAEYAPALPAVRVELTKRIPAGAGLGGGSSDAAAMLKGLVELFEVPISGEELAKLALRLGADVPFFLANEPRFAAGIGEVLTPLPVDLREYRIEVVTPPIHSDTREAYRNLKPEHWSGALDLARLLQLPVPEWRGRIRNDFEPSVFARFPLLAEQKAELYERGAVYAAMSGSGSALFGIFRA